MFGTAASMLMVPVIFALMLAGAVAQAGAPDRAGTAPGSGWSYQLGPAADLYPRSIADPHRSGFALTYGHVLRSDIIDAGRNRLLIRLGGSYGLVRYHPDEEPGKGYQLDLGGNFLGLFDLDRSLDNIGWDGLYHLLLTWTDGRGLALKIGTSHVSSHVGDEYAERTGRKRVGYTREEAVLGASRVIAQRWRVYAEAGRAYHRSNEELQKPWRGSLGLEYGLPAHLQGGAPGWYAAGDCSFFEEDGWRGNAAVQAGLVLHQDELGRRYRFGLEYYRGRSVLGEFFQDSEAVLSGGFWWDL